MLLMRFLSVVPLTLPSRNIVVFIPWFYVTLTLGMEACLLTAKSSQVTKRILMSGRIYRVEYLNNDLFKINQSSVLPLGSTGFNFSFLVSFLSSSYSLLGLIFYDCFLRDFIGPSDPLINLRYEIFKNCIFSSILKHSVISSS